MKTDFDMPTIKISLAEAKSRPFTATERARLAALLAKPDAEIDFSDQPEITDADIAAGRVRIVRRRGAETLARINRTQMKPGHGSKRAQR